MYLEIIKLPRYELVVVANKLITNPGKIKSKGLSHEVESSVLGERDSALIFGKLETGRAIPAERHNAAGTASFAAPPLPSVATLNSTMKGISTLAAAV